MQTNRTLSPFIIIAAILLVVTIIPLATASDKEYSSTPGIGFSQTGDSPSLMAATSDNVGGNSDNSNAGGNSDNSNAGGNSDNSNAGGNSDNSNAGGNSDNSNAGGNSDNSNAGGNSDNSNAGGNSDNSNAGGNSGNSNAGGNSDNSNAGGNSGNSNAGGNSDNSNAGGNSDNSNAGGNSGGATASPDTTVGLVTGNSLGISGSQITTKENAREIAVNVQKANSAGEKVSFKGSAITFSKGPVTISITTTAEPKETDGVILAGVRSISMEHQPVTAQFVDTGLASASFKADLMSLPPPDSAIAAVITDEPGQTAYVAFDQAALEQGYQMDALAYAMNITKNNLTDRKDIGQATVTMSVNSSWVADHGGVANIRIARLADDGTSQLLKTRFVGSDNLANQVFEGISPGGLSIFALITIKTPPEAVISQSMSQTPAVPGSMPLPTEMYSLLIALPVAVLSIFLTVLTRRY
jgi:hypothetical protein